ncbi:hypothetical protein Acr_00g0057620 [Actinidia rufa]|uniref:MULE transposase domain-containing protein n=1 Tax=Actinidia rufa TaxID=165716 RepID=A0A7J0DP38_9ERIC|nr:hypothetical protein Acr_00g0057620 [Actinidia rufa]
MPFEKTLLGGVLLSAIALDGNNGLFPLAVAVVECENKDSWGFFIEYLRTIIGFGTHARVSRMLLLITYLRVPIVSFLYFKRRTPCAAPFEKARRDPCAFVRLASFTTLHRRGRHTTTTTGAAINTQFIKQFMVKAGEENWGEIETEVGEAAVAGEALEGKINWIEIQARACQAPLSSCIYSTSLGRVLASELGRGAIVGRNPKNMTSLLIFDGELGQRRSSVPTSCLFTVLSCPFCAKRWRLLCLKLDLGANVEAIHLPLGVVGRKLGLSDCHMSSLDCFGEEVNKIVVDLQRLQEEAKGISTRSSSHSSLLKLLGSKLTIAIAVEEEEELVKQVGEAAIPDKTKVLEVGPSYKRKCMRRASLVGTPLTPSVDPELWVSELVIFELRRQVTTADIAREHDTCLAFHEGWLAYLQELNTTPDHPAWATAKPATILFNEKEYVNKPSEEEVGDGCVEVGEAAAANKPHPFVGLQ